MGSIYMPVVELSEEENKMEAKIQDVKFRSINLLKSSMYELEFLREVDQLGYLYERQHIHRAIYRWLQTIKTREIKGSVEVSNI